MKAVRLVILAHRYIGIPMSLLFAIWFISGITMMYTRGMPGTDDSQLQQPKVPVGQIRLAPQEAARLAGVGRSVDTVSVIGLLGRPAYRFGDPHRSGAIVFADDGENFNGTTASDGSRILAAGLGHAPDDVHYVATIEQPDQWTLTLQRQLPLLRFEIDDDKGTTAYVSERSGDVALVIDRRDKWLAWLGAIPHWFYFTPLRTHQPAWYWTIVFVSSVGCLVALLGLVLVFTQFRRSSPFRLADAIGYRGWMRWHYYSGAIFGIFIFTWIFSGLLSMEPFRWMEQSGLPVPADILSGGPVDLAEFDQIANATLPLPTAPFRLDLMQIHGRPHIAVYAEDPSKPALYDVASREFRDRDFGTDEIGMRLESALQVRIASVDLVRDYDAYYYDRDGTLPLPVVRVKLDDPDETWLYVDPSLCTVRLRNHRLSRLERWLFNGLHSLDFGFWFDSRPLWDIVVITLSLGGLASSLIGMMLGLKRLSGRRSNQTRWSTE